MSGTATVPNIIANQGGPTYPASLEDDNWTAILNYINAREITEDVLSARPAAGTSGRLFFATDANGGTLFVDTGSTWVQIGFPVGGTGQTALLFAIPLWLPHP